LTFPGDTIEVKTGRTQLRPDAIKEVKAVTGKGIKRILVAVDGSAGTGRVVTGATELAERCGATVLLLHVRQKVPDILGEPYYQQVLDRYRQQAEATVEPAKALLEESGIDYEVLILEGDPATAIVDAATDEKCDLVVMGTRGLSNLQSIALGSVSHKVLQAAGCMVLVVP
jgi:nucleotide-binding universal stress UspA family protein